ncbi:MAG TPA: serine--tRNA ligase [Actinomycetes bacterium]|nr:serine--tRNA ligase [Actinomycetes bacterium]
MIDLKLVRDRPDRVRAALARRGEAGSVDRLLALDAARRALVTEVDELRAEQKRRGKEVAGADPEERQALLTELKGLAARLDEREDRLRTVDAELAELLAAIPNLPDPAAPDGGEDDAVEVRRVGTVPEFAFPVRDHLELGELLGAIDTVRAAKVSGARFGYLTGAGALLELALVRFAMDRLIPEGFTPVVPPVLVRREAMFGTGFLPTDEQQIFRTADDDLYLAGTSEVPLVAYHADEILDPATLPRRYVGFSTCFRREAGSYGRDTRGIFRVHQFDKIEMVSFVLPEASAGEHEFLLSLEEVLLQALEIPYRVVDIAVGDLGGSAARKFDCEAWIPSQQAWRELTSTSNCTDYQARRSGIRFRGPGGNEPVHTLNGTAVAVGRWVVALLENHQQPDGSVHVPAALQPHLGMQVITPPTGIRGT